MDNPRKIIHVDMDAFYASVEILDRPELAIVPLVVGGSPDSRGVVCTANYIARKYGIRSAMACSHAKRLCPSAVFIKPRFERYVEISKKIREIFGRYSSIIEPLSLDEAYIDVTDNQMGLYASTIAKKIRSEIYEELGLTCSAGVAPSKLVAKIASEFNKPNGLTVVTPEQVDEFMRVLPVRKIHGVGPATEKRLLELGIKTCDDIRKVDPQIFKRRMGSYAEWVFNASFGIDHRKVHTSRERKSFGQEETLAKDTTNIEALRNELMTISSSLFSKLHKRELKPKTITLKVKYYD
ncbi:MAG: DNA polymerase IV, partial [Proteobacteria bacterium]|nr:DNA polymerase IV [Pseudomonadota bacterium]